MAYNITKGRPLSISFIFNSLDALVVAMVMADGTAKEEEPATVSLLSLDCTRHTLSCI